MDDRGGSTSLAVRLMQVAGEFELERKREKSRLEAKVSQLLDTNADLEHINRIQQQDLEDTNRRVAKLSNDIDKLASMGSERVKDVEQQLVVTRWQLAERTQQLLALHRALKGLQTAPAPTRLIAHSENDDPVSGSANSLAVCASLRSSLGLDLDATLAELEAAATRVQAYSVEAVLAAAGRGDTGAFERIVQPSAASDPLAAAPDAASQHGIALVLGQALCRAAAGGHAALVSRCLALGADASIASTHSPLAQSAFLLAAAEGHEAVVKLLLGKAGGGGGAAAAVDERDAYRRTALHLAAAGNHAAVAKLLLFNGADPSAVDANGLTPGDIAEGTEGLLSPPPPAAADKGDAGRRGAHFRTGELAVNRRAPAVLKVLADPNVSFWNASVRANRAYQDRQFQKAIAAYSDALSLATGGAQKQAPPAQRMAASPRDLATLFYNRARSQYRIGAHCAAIDDCTTALEHDPSYRNALAQRAESYMSVFDHKRAVADFQSLLDGDSNDTQWARRLVEARAMRDISHYGVLGVRRDVDAATLKRAYRALCLRWHPDKHAVSPEDKLRANTAFGRITDAYEVLSDQFKRMLYDMEPASYKGAPSVTDPALGGGGGGGSSARGGGAGYAAPEGFDRWHAREMERDREYERARAVQVAAEAEAEQALEERRAAARAACLRAVTTAAAAPSDAALHATGATAKPHLRVDPLSQRSRGGGGSGASAVQQQPGGSAAAAKSPAAAPAAPPPHPTPSSGGVGVKAPPEQLRPTAAGAATPLTPLAAQQPVPATGPAVAAAAAPPKAPLPPTGAPPMGSSAAHRGGARAAAMAFASAAASAPPVAAPASGYSAGDAAGQQSPGRRAPQRPAGAGGAGSTPSAEPAAAAALAAAERARTAMEEAESFVRHMQGLTPRGGSSGAAPPGGDAAPALSGLRAAVEARVRQEAAAAASMSSPGAAAAVRPRGGGSDADDDDDDGDAHEPAASPLDDSVLGGDGAGDEDDDDDDEEDGTTGLGDDGNDTRVLLSEEDEDDEAAAEPGLEDSASLPPAAPPLDGSARYDPFRYAEAIGTSARGRAAAAAAAVPGLPGDEADISGADDDDDVAHSEWMRTNAAAAAAVRAAAAAAGGSSSPAFARAFARAFGAGEAGGGGAGSAADDEEMSDGELAESIARMEAEIAARGRA